MAINFYKVLGELPLELTTDSLYLVGVEEGTDLYVTSNTSAVPRRLANVKHLSDSLAPNVDEYHVGDVWTHPETLIKYELYQDSTKKIWIELGNAIASSDSDQSEEGGHVIIDGNDNIMPQRGNLKITGATVTDDAFNDSTKVTITVPTISQIPGLQAELDGLVNPSFENGLIEENGTVRLGGELVEDVGISLFGNKLSFSTNALPFDTSNSGIDGSVNTVSFQSDGKILVGGEFTDYIKRLNSDGSVDTDFDASGAGVTSAVHTVVFQPDGKILVGGEFTGYIKRLNTDGSVDTDFNAASSGLDDVIFTLDLQSNGKILVGGDFTGYIKRLNSDGSIDTDFDASGSGFNLTVHSIAIQPDGKILADGGFTNRIKRLNTDGSVDTDFDASGSGLDAGIRSLILQPDGKILVGGIFTGRVKRLYSDGSVDTSFDAGSSGISSTVYSLALQSDGKVLAGGNFTGYIKRLNANGSVDTDFNVSGSGLDAAIFTLDLHSNGKVLVGGDFTGGVKHLNSDGTILNSGLIEYEDNYHDLYTDRTLVDKEYIDSKTSILSEKIEGLKDRDAEFEIDLLKSEIQWKDDYIAIPHDAVIGNLDIEIIYCLAKTGQGVVHVSPTVSYPARPTNGGVAPREFYLKDFNTLSKSKDIERLQIGYNVKPSLTVTNVDTQRTIGRNIIFEESTGESAHSSWMVRNFGGVYPDFTGERYQSRLLPEVMGQINNLYEPTLCEKYKVNILTKPYVGGATQENVSSNPNILKVGSHYGNDNVRRDITSSSEEFLSNVIAVSASNVAADTSDWASYGFGVEFFESFAKEEINARHPDKNIYDAVGQCYTTNGGFNLKSDVHPTAFLEALTGDKAYIHYSASNIVEREIAEVISASEIRLTESITAIASPGVYVFMYQTLGRHCGYKISQSAACAIIAAKFRQIQDRTDANWQICREAARATASNSTFTTVGDKKVWATNWDMYRGFGIIDVNSAVEYIEQNYINNDDYKSSVVAAMPTINPFISADDLEEDNYISKKMLSTAVNEGIQEITASNGLSRTENTVKLGGVLTEDTEVDLSSNRLAFSRNMPFVLSGTSFNDTVVTLAIQPGGKIVVGGAFSGYLRRLNPDGSLDPDLNAVSSGIDGTVRAISLQPDGKILVGGDFTDKLKRLNSDGSADTSFNPSSSVVDGNIWAMDIQPDGKIVIGGALTGYVRRLNSDGSVDSSFDASSAGFNSLVRSVISLPYGGSMIGGSFTGGRVKLLKPNGALDPSFNSSSSGFDNSVYSIALQPDGKVLAGGNFTGYIKRLNSDGSVDTSFDVSGSGFNTVVYSIVFQPDGKILIGGEFTGYIKRLNTDGSVDENFDASSAGFNSIVRSVTFQLNGKILVGGAFTGKLKRLNSDGSVETENILSSELNRGLLEHGDNYRDFYTSRTLVDKEYVDGRIVKANAEKTTPIIEGAVTVTNGVLSSSELLALLRSKDTPSYILPNGYSFILINTSDNLKYLLTKVGGSFYQNLLTAAV